MGHFHILSSSLSNNQNSHDLSHPNTIAMAFRFDLAGQKRPWLRDESVAPSPGPNDDSLII
jgi:hypothetical protein